MYKLIYDFISEYDRCYGIAEEYENYSDVQQAYTEVKKMPYYQNIEIVSYSVE